MSRKVNLFISWCDSVYKGWNILEVLSLLFIHFLLLKYIYIVMYVWKGEYYILVMAYIILSIAPSDQLLIIGRYSFKTVQAKHYTFHHDLSSLPLSKIEFSQLWNSVLYTSMSFSSQIFSFVIFFFCKTLHIFSAPSSVYILL